MQSSFVYELSPQLIRYEVRSIILRRGIPFFVGLLVLTALGIALIASRGNDNLFIIAMLLTCFYVGRWVNYYRRSIKGKANRPNNLVTVLITPNELTFQASEYSTTMSWTYIKKVQRSPKVWRLWYADGGYSILPAEALNEELKKFVLQKIKKHGGQVV